MNFNHLPVTPLRVTSKFGKRNTGIAGASTNHKGVDLGRDFSKTQTTIHSVKDGKIVKNYWNDYRGWVVVIQHDDYDGKTVKTLYQHLKEKSPVKVGTKVKAGQQIGIMGASSNPKKLKIAEHLHFELQFDDVPVDPLSRLNNIVEVEDLTREETKALIKEVINEMVYPKGDAPSDWAKGTWDDAKADGITDGSNPKSVVTREQCVAMLYRMAGVCKND